MEEENVVAENNEQTDMLLSTDDYRFKLDNFEGPLDLLLHLIKEAKLDIATVKLADVTEQYLNYMQDLKNVDMDKASEFITVAATLIEIKSKKLLPVEQESVQDDEEDDEAILLRRLKEYELFKKAGQDLKQIEDAPPILYAKGRLELLQNCNMLAVVGSRSASLSALKMAETIAGDVSRRGITIVSGMARGIDAAAHSGALKAGGQTIAVLGTGIDIVYPSENENLYKELSEDGLILTEYPFRTRPQATNFPRRNRIVSGLSKGVLVIEAGLRSGSLITAHQALEQGRDVYAVPGAPYDGRSDGCNKLLKDGATLVDSADDIVENFNFSEVTFTPRILEKVSETDDLFEYSLDKPENNSDSPKQNNEYDKLLSLISSSGEDIDELIRTMDLPTEKVLTMIVELELDDKITRLPGNRVGKI